MARVIFGAIEHGRALLNFDRATFASRAAEFLNDLNILHPFREGNGRGQRLLLSAMAGTPDIRCPDVVTRECMVATSIATRDDVGSFVRLIEEISDPRRVEVLRKALGAMKQSATLAWNDLYVATTTTGQSYSGILAGRAGDDLLIRVEPRSRGWVAIGDVRDLPYLGRSTHLTRTSASLSRLTSRVI